MKRNGGIIGPLKSFLLGDNISGTFDMHDVHIHRLEDVWSYTKSIDVTPSTTSANETTSRVITFTVNTQGYSDQQTFYWAVNQVSGTVNSSDFVADTGDFSISGDETGGTATFDVVISTDGTPDGTDQFNVQISETQGGAVIFTTSTITISDTSTVPPVYGGDDLSLAFYSVGEFQNNDLASDTSSNYSVSEVQSSFAGTGRLYLIHKGTNATTYYNDVPIACIQVLDGPGTAVVQQWYFGFSGNGQSWTTHTSQYNFGAIGTGINITPSQAASNYSYTTNVVNGATANRFTLATSTGSSRTGAVDGIANPSGPMTLGEKTVPQSASTYYMYRETSGSTVGFCSLCRSPSRTWSTGERIRIAYIIGNSTGYTPDDTLFVGIA